MIFEAQLTDRYYWDNVADFVEKDTCIKETQLRDVNKGLKAEYSK